MVDLDAPDDVRFPQWSGASGYMVLALVQALGACMCLSFCAGPVGCSFALPEGGVRSR
jgi:hypothetical protein